MNSIEEFVQHQQSQRKWSVRRMMRRAALRVRKMFKRRLRGESRRQWVERNLNDSEAGICFDVFHCIISLMMVVSIIAQNWSQSTYTRHQSYRNIDYVNLASITISFGLRYYAAGNRKAFCLHWLSIVDICCWVPLLAEAIDNDNVQGKYEYRFFLMVRALRLLQVFRLRRLAKSAKARQSMLISLSVICILICAATGIQTIEYCDASRVSSIEGKNCQNLSFFDSLYFVCITIGTVGYGEYAPKSNMGKIATVCLIIFTGILIPTQISALTDILSRETAFDKKYVPDKRIQHVLLCGDIENSSLNFFLHTWLHGEGDRGNRRNVVILSPSLPSSSVRRVLIHRDYEQRVIYLQGSAMDAHDLKRAGAQSAAYCFVMVNKHSNSLDEDDTATNLVTCSIRKNNRHAPLFVQVSKYDNIRHVNISGASAVVCLEQLKLSMFAKSLWIHGLNAFLGNMVQRFDVTDQKGGFWLRDYVGSCCCRIYEAAIPSFLFAMPTFQSLAVLIYREFNIPLIGIRTLQEAVMVYPTNKDLNDIGFHSVFFLSKSRDMIAKIEKMSSSVFTRHPDISPNLDISAGKSNRTITNVLASMSVAALEGNFKPFQRLSVAFNTDRGSTASLQRIGTARVNDKITPLNRDDDVGDSGGPTQSSVRHSITVINGEQLVASTRHPASIRDDEGRDETEAKKRLDSDGELTYSPPTLPVVALSPAELIKKATAPVSPRCQTARSVITPRSPRMMTARNASPRRGGISSPRNGPSEEQCEHSKAPEQHALSDPLNANEEHVVGPFVSSIRDAHPTSTPPKELINQEREAGGESKVDEVGDSPPILRRSIKHDQRYSRTSKFRSFRRRAPPKNLINHFVVCGIPSSYHIFMSSLHDLDDEPPAVVFVTPRDLSEKDFSTYIEFKNVYFVRGSPVSMEIFDEARMLHAKSILIMSYCGQETNDEKFAESEQFDENMADVDAITTHRFISEACQNILQKNPQQSPGKLPHRSSWRQQPSIPYIVVEMMRPSNVKFLVDRSGSLYDEKSSVNEIRARELLREAHALDDSLFSPLYAGGHVYFSNFMDALLGSTSQNSFLIDMVTQLVVSGNASLSQPDRDARSKHRLTQIPAPTRYHNRPYALMVEGLLINENTVALGLYRAPHGFVAPAHVFTNPTPNELVHASDLVFVIK